MKHLNDTFYKFRIRKEGKIPTTTFNIPRNDFIVWCVTVSNLHGININAWLFLIENYLQSLKMYHFLSCICFRQFLCQKPSWIQFSIQKVMKQICFFHIQTWIACKITVAVEKKRKKKSKLISSCICCFGAFYKQILFTNKKKGSISKEKTDSNFVKYPFNLYLMIKSVLCLNRADVKSARVRENKNDKENWKRSVHLSGAFYYGVPFYRATFKNTIRSF